MIIERAPLPIVEMQGSAHMVSHVNSAFCRLLGKSREELIGKSFAEIVHGGDKCVPILDRVYQTGEAATLAQEDDSDSASWLYAMWPALDANEQPEAVIIQLAKTAKLREDTAAVNEALLIAGLRQHELTEEAEKLNAQLLAEIAERKDAEEKLRESELAAKRALDYAEATLRTTPVPFLVLRADLRVNTASEAFYTDFKVRPDETEGQLIYEIGNGQWNIPKLRELLEEIIPKKNVFNGFEVTHEFATIGTRTMLLNARRIDNAEGVPERILLAIEDITDRKQASQYARSLIEASLDPLVTISAEGKITDVNEGSIKVTGVAREKLIGTDFSDYFTEPEKARQGYQLVFAKGFVTNYPLTILHKDGRLTDVLYNASVYKDVSGRVLGVFAAARDVTERKQAEEMLARLGSIVSSADDGILSKTLDGVVTTWNASAERLFGYTAAEIIGNPSLHLTPPDLHHEEAHILQQILAGKAIKHLETQRMTKDGRRLPVSLTISPIKDAEGKVVGASKIVRDITERKKAEETLRASEERFRVAVRAVSNIVWTNSAEGEMVGSQPGWAHFTGQTQEEYQGYGWAGAVHPDDAQPTIDAWNLAVVGKQPFHFEHRVRRHDGVWRRCSVRALPTIGPGGEIREWVGVHNDVTDERAAADALLAAKEQAEAASRAKDDFLAALSHELRTPLTPVLMTATALETDPSLSADVRDQLAMMRRNIELEARLIDDLLDLTRISRGKLSIAPVASDIHQLLTHTEEIVRSDGLGKQVRVVFVLEAVRHHALADPARLQQVFWNLIKNALKFTPTGGTITVRTRNDAEGWIVVSVEDNGIGIAAEALPHIFKAFEQGDVAGQHRYGGLGLGLAISQAIVTVHGGIIRAESPGGGQGATFTVALATVAAPAVPSGTENSPAEPVRALRLLVVEDHEATRTVLTRLLTRNGHRVTAASTVREALVCFDAERFDAVVSDLGLPDGSGLDLMRELQRRRPIPGIALSGYGMEDDVRQTKEAGFFAHLVKPVNIGQLRQLLAQVAAPRA